MKTLDLENSGKIVLDMEVLNHHTYMFLYYVSLSIISYKNDMPMQCVKVQADRMGKML